jgi:cell division septation protein DedD
LLGDDSDDLNIDTPLKNTKQEGVDELVNDVLDDPDEVELSEAASVEVGWVVQVGVFTDKKGAARVVQDLQSKGFKPSTSIVDTNQGKATGARIWLGPYSQRIDAAKAKTELTNRTGEAGFIRAYP